MNEKLPELYFIVELILSKVSNMTIKNHGKQNYNDFLLIQNYILNLKKRYKL